MADTTTPMLALPPKASTPLDPPVVYYNKKWRVAPLVVDTQEEADALDPAEWQTNPPPVTAAAAAAEFPKLYYNVNVPPVIVGTAADAKALGAEWQEFILPEPLVKAAQATIDAAQAKS